MDHAGSKITHHKPYCQPTTHPTPRSRDTQSGSKFREPHRVIFQKPLTPSFGLQDVIWRGVYSTPAGPQATGYGHIDHVHITTTPRG